MRALVVDDIEDSKEALVLLLKRYCPDVETVGEASTLEEALDKIQRLGPDLVFLDIELGADSGLEMLKQFGNRNFQVIFTTGHSEHALEAFDVNATDYLVKPILPNRLKEAVAKAQKSSDASKKRLRLEVSTNDGTIFLEQEDIYHVESLSGYCVLLTRSHEKIKDFRTIGRIEACLDKTLFFRCHNSHLINLDQIIKVVNADGGEAVLKNGSKVPISRRRKEDLLQRMRER